MKRSNYTKQNENNLETVLPRIRYGKKMFLKTPDEKLHEITVFPLKLH